MKKKLFFLIIFLFFSINCHGSTFKWISQFDRYWGIVKYSKIEKKESVLNWDSLYLKWYPQIVNAKSQNDVNIILINFTKEFDIVTWKKVNKKINTYTIYKGLEDIDKNLLTYINFIKREFKCTREKKRSHYSFCNPKINFPCFKNEASYDIQLCKQEAYRSLALAKFWNVIEYFYPYKDHIPSGWDDVLDKYIPRFIASISLQEYILLTRELNVEILDPHAATSIQGSFAKLYAKHPPFTIAFDQDKIFLENTSDPNLSCGDQLLIYDSLTINSLFTDRIKLYRILNLSINSKLVGQNMLLSTKDSIYYSILRNGKDTVSGFFKTINWSETLTLKKKLSYLELDTAHYLNLSCYSDSAFMERVAKLNKDKTLILDLRDYPSVSHNIVGLFTKNEIYFGNHLIPKRNYPGEFKFYKKAVVQPISTSIDFKFKEIIVLINHETISKAEYIAAAFKGLDGVKIIGTNSAGAMGTLTFIELPGKVVNSFSVTGFYSKEGKSILETGIIPDIFSNLSYYDKTIKHNCR